MISRTTPTRSAEEAEFQASIQEVECTICYESFDREHRPALVQACGHIFGAACLTQWAESNNAARTQCPNCRGDLVGPSATIIDEDGQLFDFGVREVAVIEDVWGSIFPLAEAPRDNRAPSPAITREDMNVRHPREPMNIGRAMGNGYLTDNTSQNTQTYRNGRVPTLNQRVKSAIHKHATSIKQKSDDLRTAFHNRRDNSDIIMGFLVPGRQESSRTAARARTHNLHRLRGGGSQHVRIAIPDPQVPVNMYGIPRGVAPNERPALARATVHDNGGWYDRPVAAIEHRQ
ncbi:hypothetical protein T440DRAFT_137146 [Plenodomus tracheiphilus IPT5]|uniref:RING-type domain-containing protein n=1 Tax=Plenodomus tracheiphilus IPT5 TaxID=1408161 RepID=A0A6A7B1S6_9PLEO|nr:hypothetical protein T440DRAFT_137146 [Plenodomus tracheiphilus IPT5]